MHHRLWSFPQRCGARVKRGLDRCRSPSVECAMKGGLSLDGTRFRTAGVVAAVYFLFVVSGFTGLAYEVVWARLLVRVFGASSLAVTTILASYMAGLALGSLLLGRVIDRVGIPLRVYGLLELGIGGFAIGFPRVISRFDAIYGGLYPALDDHFYLLTLIRFLICFGILLIPTILMGGTLPVLSKHLASSLSNLAGRVGRLYAVNTLGAVGGAFAAGLVILPRLGINNTTMLCAALNLCIAAAAMLLARKDAKEAGAVPAGMDRTPSERSYPSGLHRQILAVFMVTGFCALAAEVVWTRMLSLALGTTVYAFAVMLAVFLLGLGTGSATFAPVAQRSRNPARVLGLVIAGVGIGVFLSLLAFGRIAFLYMSLYQHMHPSGGGLLWIQLLLCGITMLLPSFLMGGIFPLVARLYARDITRVGREIGQAYGLNTVGAILGSVAGSFLFLGHLGMENSLMAIGAVYSIAGLTVIVKAGEFRHLGARVATAGGVVVVTVAVLLTSPGIDRKTLTCGVYRYAPIYATVEGLKTSMRRISLLFYDEGIDATVSVEKFRGEVSILIDGKADASSGIGDMRTQVLLAQLPLLLHTNPDTVLVIGLGSGVTLGSAETHDLGLIDCVELLENVVEASDYMREYNQGCLADPRAHLIIGDGRNHLLLTRRSYDVIISEPTNPWISGVGDLFTREFFGLARKRLTQDGIMCAWFHTYHMGDEDVRAMVATFMSVFPNTSLWLINDGDIILLGGMKPITIGERVEKRMGSPAVAGDLERIRIGAAPDLVSFLVAGPAGLAEYAGSAGKLHTDDNMMLEFSAGLRVLESTEYVHLSNFLDLIDPSRAVSIEGLGGEDVLHRAEARKLAIRAALAMSEQTTVNALPLLEEALSLSPTDPYIIDKYIEARMIVGNALYMEGDYDGAASNYLAALIGPDQPMAWRVYLGLGTSLAAGGNLDGARRSYLRSIELNPDNPMAYHDLGKLERVDGNMEAAVAAFEQSLQLEPDADVASDLSRVYMELGANLDAAARLAEQAVSWQAGADHYITLGWARNRLGEYRKAEEAMAKASEIEPDNTEALSGLATMRLARGDIEGARSILRRLIGLGKDDAYSRRARRQMAELERQ
jgi:spermidine synthase